MRDFFRYILAALVSSMVLVSLQGCKEDGIIEEDTMAQIYAEMLLTDQWINSTSGMRMIADTSLVYEPILRKYGHTSGDYRKSVDYYLADPEAYADIMTQTVKILDDQLADLNMRKAEIDAVKDRAKFVQKISRDLKLNDSLFVITRIHEEKFGAMDTLAVKWDSLSLRFNIIKVHVDSLAVADSLIVADSLAVADTLPQIDSLPLPVLDTLKIPTVAKNKALRTLRNGARLQVNDTLYKNKR